MFKVITVMLYSRFCHFSATDDATADRSSVSGISCFGAGRETSEIGE